MRKFLIAWLIALIPTVALAQHRGGFHRGGEFHRGHGVGMWPWIVGGSIVGGAIVTDGYCTRWVVDPAGYWRKIWIC